MTAEDILIRRADSGDKPALRKLAVDTAYFGLPCEHFFPDRELLADLIMEYYARYEPYHTWVAEYNGEVIGYLSAGFDESKYSRYMLRRIVPGAVFKALLRGKIWSLKTVRLIWYNLLVSVKGESKLSAADKHKYSVHIHQNLRDGFRGKKIGSRLMKAFLDYADTKKVGIRFRALRIEDKFPFFDKYGFKRFSFRRVPTWERWLGKQPLYFMEYTRDAANS